MSADFVEQYIVVKGYIDARDERQRTIYGTFMSVVSRHDMRYLGVMFGSDPVAKETELDDLFALLRNSAGEVRDAAFLRDEAELVKFLDVSRSLQGLARNRNPKQAEQAISRFCAESLNLKAVTFIEYLEANDSMVEHFAPPKQAEEESVGEEPQETGHEAGEGSEGDEDASRPNLRDYIVRCNPVLDPVNGIAMTDLSVGDYISVKLPGDSVFYKLLASNLLDFDGVINAKVSGILVNELGTATASLELAPGVAGVMKISGKAKVKSVPPPGDAKAKKRRPFAIADISADVIFGGAIIFLLLCAVALIVYLLM